MRAWYSVLLLLVHSACMTYDFEPVVPLAVAQTTVKKTVIAKFLKPNVMLVVDKSGSMEAPINPANPNCPANCGSSASICPASCPTRISDLRNAMSAFLSQSATDARMGLTFYPADTQCTAPSTVDVALPTPTADDNGTDSALSMNSSSINARIQSIVPFGGTPTAASLAFAGTIPGLLDNGDSRDDYILLLTDGLPNCNDANPNQMCTCDPGICNTCGGVCQAQIDRCRCTLQSCQMGNCARGCLDQDAVVAATRTNRLNGIKTIVVGFGADTATGDAANVLNAIAEQGDFARECEMGTDAECGTNNRCLPNKLCEKKYYQATNAAELSAALQNIILNIKGDACELKLAAPPSLPDAMAVIVNEKNVPPGPDTWVYAGGTTITFQGQLCADFRASTPLNPFFVEVRVVDTF